MARKRPIEAKAESGSDPEIEESLRKAKEDEEKWVELHHRRGENALRFNVIPTTGTPSWVTEGGHIFKSDLNIQAKHWLGFVCSRFTPSKNDNEIPNTQAILISCIMVVDIMKIQDDMSPKMKKRKKEPTVSHPPEATMSHDTHIVNALLDEIVSSWVATSVALTPVDSTIKDLEHKVSELECIGNFYSEDIEKKSDENNSKIKPRISNTVKCIHLRPMDGQERTTDPPHFNPEDFTSTMPIVAKAWIVDGEAWDAVQMCLKPESLAH
ncbi:hypothetical protein HAX54_016569 [Datura stramonium]|uniref:Uncharacterized protein n=1 Tax=Datura stramonium TaxID=4076 RepID=A0ABS8UKA8_DATST|nr:hypothetical protein [Datura stramonium]